MVTYADASPEVLTFQYMSALCLAVIWLPQLIVAVRDYEVVQISIVSVGAAGLGGAAMVATNVAMMADENSYSNPHLWAFSVAGLALVVSSIALVYAKHRLVSQDPSVVHKEWDRYGRLEDVTASKQRETELNHTYRHSQL